MAGPFNRVWTRQPQVATGVNWANPLSVGLVFAAYGGGPDIVSGTLPTYASGAGRTPISDGVASAAGAGSVTYALPSGHNLYNITTTDTVFASERIDTVAAYGCLCIVEYRQAGGSPYIAWGYTSDGFGTSPQDWIASNGSTFSDGQTASARISAAPKVSHGKVRTTTETRYFVNGEVVETKSRAAITPDFVNKRPLVVGNAGNAVSVLLIWNRPLSDLEYKKIHNNPWQLFAPLRRPIFVPAAAGGSSSSITVAAAASSTSTLTGSSTNAATVTGAAGASATSTITGRSTNAATVTGAAGVASTSTLTAGSTNAATLTGAAGASTTGTLVGSAGSTNSVISDISGGWTPSSGSDNWAMVDEASYSDADYTTSPDLTTPEVFGITARAAGTWDVNYRALRTGATGDVRMVLRNSGGSVVGTGTWQTMLASFASYTDTITTSGVAEQLEVEIRA